MTASKDGNARLWDWRTGKLACPPLAHVDELYDAAFLSDSRLCATSERGDRIHFWDLTSGKRVAAPIRFSEAVDGTRQNESIGPVAVVRNQVFVSAESPMIDASRFLTEPIETSESLLWLSELATGQRLQQGAMRSLTSQEWAQTWEHYAENTPSR